MYGTGTAREAASIMATTGKNVKQPESLGKGDALNKPAVRKQAPYKLSEVGKKVPLGKHNARCFSGCSSAIHAVVF
jgi:hypothetical protein